MSVSFKKADKRHGNRNIKVEKSTMVCHYSITFTLIVHHDNYNMYDGDNDEVNNARKTQTCYNFIFFSYFLLSPLKLLQKYIDL